MPIRTPIAFLLQLMMAVFFCVGLHGQMPAANIYIYVDPLYAPYGSPAAVHIYAEDANGNPTSATILCGINPSGNGGTVQSDSSGNATYSTPGTLSPGQYTVTCTAGLGSTASGTADYYVVQGSCSATDASSIDYGSTNNPSYITWNLSVNLSPGGQVNPGSVTGYGKTGQQTGYYDCNANPLTTPPASPTLEPQGFVTNQSTLTYSWIVHNKVYVPGDACQSGYCNGVQDLDTAEGTPTSASITASCDY